MFTTNTVSIQNQPLSNAKKNKLNIMREWSQSQKRKTINLLRLFTTRESLPWNISYEKFIETLENCNNLFSLLSTLFEITEDPLWRNRTSHICILIKKLHNVCIQTYGGYLNQLSRIEGYHGKLLNIFYLNDSQIQDHFKSLIKIYLNLNSKYNILDEQCVAVALIDAGKNQKLVKLPEYLWIVSQIRTGDKAIAKLLKIAQDCINSSESNKLAVILPILTTLSNYIYHEKRLDVLEQLLNNMMFQSILVLSLQTVSNIQIAREALLLCNNILAKSFNLSQKLMSSGSLMTAASLIECEEQFIFQKLVSIRKNQMQ